jgi:hypothetical protein
VIFSARVSIGGVGVMHNLVRDVPRGIEKAYEAIYAMREVQSRHRFTNVSTMIVSMNLRDSENILACAWKEKLDVVFTTIRFTDPMLGNTGFEQTQKPAGPDEERMRRESSRLPAARSPENADAGVPCLDLPASSPAAGARALSP